MNHEKNNNIDIKKEALKEIFDLILENQWVSTAVFFGFGLIIYFAYFYLNYSYIPSLTWGEIFSIMVSLSTIFLLLPILILIFVFLFWLFYYVDKNLDCFETKNYKFFTYYKSIFIWITSFLIFLISFCVFIVRPPEIFNNFVIMINSYADIDLTELIVIFVMFVMFIVPFIFLNLIIRHRNNKFISIVFFISLMLIFLFISFFIFSVTNVLWMFWFIFFIAIILFYLSLNTSNISKFEFKLFFSISFSAILFLVLVLTSGHIIKILNYGNIDYEILILDKQAINILPDEISRKNTDDNKTYVEYVNENSNNFKIKLHNVKALSTLGKFYYLQTKDDFRFEIDSSYIKTKIRSK
ncbi:hypothetical protein BFG04_03540 [Campylobacter pinnipediorum subsp. pinnipediorum]|uniref:Uncharacterized protein n=1 Tax=Campylobacter pinnipediorum subsp. pinnipediorum TaxID=1660067 RepID=A0AAX0LA60_9BACT|nr:hypothetical protein [Campylobacter pinnipediorum]OPA78002.1 hypothetical protein BFG04_03540 [Campylobacter pinnipediorum subsp. pinnipediorum]